MHLKSITLRGFKSFPDSRRLDFAPGVSVIVGPNGSGKSNIADALVWALGEQSPQAVRGQSMQDVIFAGGHGARPRDEAEVEVVIDNSAGRIGLEFEEVSIKRRVTRAGGSEYRINGARCRLTDVLEALSDTGLGKEMHSVVGQGRVEHVIHSKPEDRRRLVEEAAGLGKHRRRRRRARLKLERTRKNLERIGDLEREARSHLRPLKRQAEAADLHARIERQELDVRAELASERLRECERERSAASELVAGARAARDALDAELKDLSARRESAERRLAERTKERESILESAYAVRSALERVRAAECRAREMSLGVAGRAERRRRLLDELGSQRDDAEEREARERLARLESDLDRARRALAERADREVSDLESDRALALLRVGELEPVVERARAAAERAQAEASEARERAREAAAVEDGIERERSKLLAQADSLEDRLRSGVGLGEQARTLASMGVRLVADMIEADPGYEAAVAAALGERLRSGVTGDMASGLALLDATGPGGRVLVRSAEAARGDGPDPRPPAPGAQRLSEHVRVAPEAPADLVALLEDSWLVDDLGGVDGIFRGVAVTRDGRRFAGRSGELERLAERSRERVFADRNRCESLRGEVEVLGRRLERAGEESAAAAAAVSAADERRDAQDCALRDGVSALREAREEVRRIDGLIARRRSRLDEGPRAVEIARLEAELRADRAILEAARRDRERADERRRIAVDGLALDLEIGPALEPAVEALGGCSCVLARRRSRCDEDLRADESSSERAAEELRSLAREEYGLQTRLADANEYDTRCEVGLAQAGDRETEARSALESVAARLGVELEARSEPLPAQERERLETTLERLDRRRERLGPVNPLAGPAYEEALERVERIGAERADAERALEDLEGLVAEIDRQIDSAFAETFEATAEHFGRLVEHLFPGGSGRLRLVESRAAGVGEDASSSDTDGEEETRELGVEVEVTPGGKAPRALSLLSGGEKSLASLAFLFGVFLARPCPFYLLDEVEAALDDRNIDRFLELLRHSRDRAQFIVVTHQRRTMEAADVVYGVSMGQDGISKVVSRRLPTSGEAAGSAEADARSSGEAGLSGEAPVAVGAADAQREPSQ